MLPPGTQTLLCRAFSGDTQVGASQPTQAQVTAGGVTRVVLRIIDTSGLPETFGPIFDALVFPTSLEAGASGTFTLSVIAPAGDPVSYQWSSDCADSTFSAPQAATTSWSKATPGSCGIDVTATSNGIQTSQSFRIVVFPQGTTNGAVDVNGVFVEAPSISLNLSDVACFAAPFSDGSCTRTIASPATSAFTAFVGSWGVSTPGSITVSDDCGGRAGVSNQSSDFAIGTWLPPVAGGLCRITARAVNGDGGEGAITAAILVRPGTAPVVQPPQISAALFSSGGMFFCGLNPDASVVTECGSVPAGAQVNFQTSVSWLDGLPFSLTFTDDCGGGTLTSPPNSPFGLQTAWSVSGDSGRTCTVTMQATNLQGFTSQTTAHYHIN